MTGGVSKEASEAARRLVFDLGGMRPNESVCIVSDTNTQAIGTLLAETARTASARVDHRTVAPFKMHGTEPPPDVAAAMAASALVIGVTGSSMAHTGARVSATRRGARYLSLPEYDWTVLEHPSLRVDYRKPAARARELADVLARSREVRVVSPAGTDIVLHCEGRLPNYCPGFVGADISLGSPPDIEANISPLEDSSEGIAVIDGSIAHPSFGVLTTPIRLTVRGGRIAEMDGPRDWVERLEHMFEEFGDKARVLAEFGIGLNPAAVLCGKMLIDEGALGTFHFGFGSNSTVGGKNTVAFHLDFIFYATEFLADGERIRV